jgi:hypothetical protein
MNIRFSLAAFSLVTFWGFTWKKAPANNIVLGNYRYDIALEKSFNHDDNTYSTYFVVKRAKSNTKLCSSTLLTTRNDSVLTTGQYCIDGPRLLFRERYFGPKQIRGFVFADSVQKTFASDRNGQLQLTEIRQYKGGQITYLRY